MFKASKWLKSMRNKTTYQDVTWGVTTAHDPTQGKQVWLTLYTEEGSTRQYIVMDPQTARWLADALTNV